MSDGEEQASMDVDIEEQDLSVRMPRFNASTSLMGTTTLRANHPQDGLSLSFIGSLTRVRGQWENPLDYLMVLLGYAIGIGNLWRFPYLVGKWGGGSFVLAYLVCLVLVASPLFLMELIWGQSSQKSTMDCLRAIHPKVQGVGIGCAMLIFIVCSYYNVLLAYCMVYIVGSFQDPLPWTTGNTTNGVSPAERYWQETVLNAYDKDSLDGRTGMGEIQWPLAVGLLVVYSLIWLALSKGHDSMAWAAKLLVIMPVVLLTIVVIRALFLPGMEKGLEFYLGKFESDNLLKGEMWAAACGQILFSLSPGMGTAITMSSFTNPNENVFRVNAIVSICNSSFSLFGGIAVFGILGHLSHESGVPVEDLAKRSGTGLAFITIAEGLGTFGTGWSQVMSVLFFFMLMMLGLDSSFAWIETLNTYINDYLDSKGIHPKKWQTAACSAVVLFLTGLPYCTRMGNYLLDVVDHYPTTYTLLFLVFSECIVLHFCYTVTRLNNELKEACGATIPKFWQFTLNYLSPVIVIGLTIFLLVDDISESYGGYPGYLQAVGWTLFLLPLLPIPYCYFQSWRSDFHPQRVRVLSKGPRRENHGTFETSTLMPAVPGSDPSFPESQGLLKL
eukprot:TRINITY_DN409_c1_g1_i4.p1 TRINITY_DN409_c1_g1~~TRINITY_DN409_c1_g1_i4.p1  ORF type:complete len:613 (+),score=182.78 TRINITY_DN409_c1_g1_i4:1234-3072(+)